MQEIKKNVKQMCCHGRRRLLELIYPLRCPFCDRILDPQEKRRMICGECQGKIVYITKEYCLKCGKPVDSERREYCPDCETRKHFFDQGRSLLSYQGAVRHSLYRYKNSNRRDYALFYAKAIDEQFTGWIFRCRIDYLVPVPLYPRKKRERGYNQSEILAQELGRLTEIRVKRKLLRKKTDTRQQKTLNAAERRKNLMHAFEVVETLHGENILLVDDIYTTGATADMAAKALKDAGAGNVYVICVGIGSLS